jgi:uncharacterized membrane protein (DUF4010 family)
MGPALIVAAGVAIGFALITVWWRIAGSHQPQKMEFRNPFGFWSVVGFAIFLGLIIVLGRIVGEAFSTAGAIAGAIVVGLVDVDSVTISMTQLTPAILSVGSAAYAVLAAVASNTIGKIAIGAMIGRGRYAAELAILAMICLIGGGVTFALTLVLLPRLAI